MVVFPAHIKEHFPKDIGSSEGVYRVRKIMYLCRGGYLGLCLDCVHVGVAHTPGASRSPSPGATFSTKYSIAQGGKIFK